MKNRFYDAKMHGADWTAEKATYEPLLQYLVDEEELHTVMMMMIGELNASHTGVSGGPCGRGAHADHPLSGIRPRQRRLRTLQGRPCLQGRPRRSRLPQDQGRQLHRLGGRPRAEDVGELLAVLHARAGHEVPLRDQRQAVEGGRLGRHHQPGVRRGVRQPPVRAVGGRSPRDGHEAQQRGDRIPPHPGDGRAVAATVPARSGGKPHEEGARDRPALQRRRRHRPGAARDSRRAPVPVHRRPRPGLPDAAPAELLRADGRDAERTLGLRCRDVPRGLQGARPRQDGRRADDGRGDWHRVLHAARRFDDPDAWQRCLDGDRPEHGELRRAAGRVHRQHAGRFRRRDGTRRSKRRSKC